MGVWSGAPDGFDIKGSDLPVSIISPGHPVAHGVAASFTLLGNHSYEADAPRGTGRNPDAVKVGDIDGADVVAAGYGDGCSVYLPAAVGCGGMNRAANPDYLQLFVNAVLYCGGAQEDEGPIEVGVDVKPGSDRNPVNLKGRKKGKGNGGGVPVAILTTDDLDAADVDAVDPLH